jgi:hypothetical protein
VSLAAALLLLADAGQANDPEIGSRLKPRLQRTEAHENNAARATTYRFVECGVNLNESSMRRILEVGAQKNYDDAMDQMEKRRGCNFTGRVSYGVGEVVFGFDNATLRGMIAEAFVKKQRGIESMTSIPLQTAYKRDWHAITTRHTVVDEMATCVAETNPSSIMQLLETEHGSTEETAAVRTISPSLGTCLGAGAKLTANRTAIRSALAEALYHRSYDAPPPSAGVSQ